MKKNRSVPLIIFILWLSGLVLESLIAVVMLLNTPRDPNNVFLFGLSKDRLILLFGLLTILLASGISAVALWVSHQRGERIVARLSTLVNRKIIYLGLAFISLTGIVIFSQLFHLSVVVSDPYVYGYLLRLRPFIFLALSLCFYTFWLLPLIRHGVPDGKRIFEKQPIVSGLVFFVILLLVGLVVAVTGLGIKPDLIGWDAPGVPVLIYQAGMVWFCGFIYLVLSAALLNKDAQSRRVFLMDLLLSLVIWVVAVVFWSQEPLAPSFFTPQPRAPNYEFYPHSDAALHDTFAQNLLIGSGFTGVSRKPIYALFLALLHGLVGQAYDDVIFLQVLFMAIFPVALYWLGKRMHHRVSGVIAAGLIIVRETNSIRLAGSIGVSHAKMLMSDLPATVAVVLVTWLLVIWSQEPAQRRYLPLVIGGGLGLLLLLRPQTTVLVPAVILLVILVTLKRPRIWLLNAGLVALGLLLTLAPWLWRSHQLTGEFALNDPSQTAFLTQQYHLEPGTSMLSQSPDESQDEFIQRVNQYLRDFVLDHPAVVAEFITSHFAHNQVEMIQVLPLSFWFVQNPDSDLFPYWQTSWQKMWGECCSAFSYVNQIGYWDPQRESIQPNQLVPLVVNLWVIAIGLGVIWARQDLSGWIPLAMSLVYSFSTSVGRYSGWRLILPADWVVFLYLALGLGQISIWLFVFYSGGKVSDLYSQIGAAKQVRMDRTREDKKFPLIKTLILGLFFLILGLLPVMVEVLVPAKYPLSSKEELVSQVWPQLDGETRQFIQHNNVTVLHGLALYPRFYKAGEGEPGVGWPAFAEQDYARLGFVVLTYSQRYNVILPMLEPPGFFPNASDTIVVGCQEDDYIDAVAVQILDEDKTLIQRSHLQDLTCPPLDPGTGD